MKEEQTMSLKSNIDALEETKIYWINYAKQMENELKEEISFWRAAFFIGVFSAAPPYLIFGIMSLLQ